MAGDGRAGDARVGRAGDGGAEAGVGRVADGGAEAGNDGAGNDRVGNDGAGTGAGEPWDSRYAAFTERGRAALLGGEQTYDRPLGETRRWGVSVVFRPSADVMARLGELSRDIGTVLERGHWIHGPGCWHTTLRALEFYRPEIPAGDERISTYAAALDEAVAGLPPFDVEVRGLSPHHGGLLLFVRPAGKTLLELRSRMDDALHARDACTSEKEHVRDIWNIGLVHFTGPLADPATFVAWCDARRDLDLGTTTFDTVDIVRAFPAQHDVRLETLHRAALLDPNRGNPPQDRQSEPRNPPQDPL